MGIKLNHRSPLAQLFPSCISPDGSIINIVDIMQQKINESTKEFYAGNCEPTLNVNLNREMRDVNISFGYESDTSAHIKDLDTDMKTAIQVSILELQKLQSSGPSGASALTWDNVQKCFNTNPALVPLGQSQEIVESFISDISSNFKFSGSPDPTLVQRVMHWWANKACPDREIRNNTQLNIESFAKIVAISGAAVTNFVNLFRKHKRHEYRILEVGVIRFPSLLMPYFKIYRIQLYIWSDCTRTVWHQEDKNGITSVINSQCFTLNREVLDKVLPEAKMKAAHAINNLINEN